IRAGPPRLIRVAHHQRAEDVGATCYLVGHDADARLEVVVAPTELVERDERAIARAVGVVYGRPIDRLAVFPDRELLRDREGLAVSDDHADDVMVWWHPTHDERIDAHESEADLAFWSGGMFEGERRQLLFVRAPTHFGCGRALLAKALDAPGVHELI